MRRADWETICFRLVHIHLDWPVDLSYWNVDALACLVVCLGVCWQVARGATVTVTRAIFAEAMQMLSDLVIPFSH